MPTLTFKQYREQLAEQDRKYSHRERTIYVDGWEVVNTDHGKQRTGERTDLEDNPKTWEEYVRRAIARIEYKGYKPGEFLITSRSLNQSVIFNVDLPRKQLRAITILPPGKHYPNSPRTGKIVIESITYNIVDVIELD